MMDIDAFYQDLVKIYEGSDSLYKVSQSGKFKLIEPQNNKDEINKISEVDFHYPEKVLVFNDKLLSKSTHIYETTRKCKEIGLYVYPRENCDGFIMTSFNGVNYLIWVELKSGYSQVYDKAIFQIASSYFRTKSYLNIYSNFKENQYKEFGIIVSRPSEQQELEDNEAVSDRKKDMVDNDKADLKNKYRRKFKKDSIVWLEGNDFGYDKLHLSDDVKLDKIPVINCQLAAGNEVIDLKDVMDKINDFK